MRGTRVSGPADAGTALAAVTSGQASGALALGVGSNPITVRVTAPDSTTNDYTVSITRQAQSALTARPSSAGEAQALVAPAGAVDRQARLPRRRDRPPLPYPRPPRRPRPVPCLRLAGAGRWRGAPLPRAAVGRRRAARHGRGHPRPAGARRPGPLAAPGRQGPRLGRRVPTPGSSSSVSATRSCASCATSPTPTRAPSRIRRPCTTRGEGYIGAFGRKENWLEERPVFGPESVYDLREAGDDGN